jgi:hypothetical protein
MSRYPISDDERDARAEDFQEKRMASEAWHSWRDKYAALESDNARLRERADAAEGLAKALENLMHGITSRRGWMLLDIQVEQATAALKAYKQAGGKGG